MAFIVDDIIDAFGASAAADKQEEAAQKAMDLQREMYNQSRQDQMPWMQVGRDNLGSLMSQMNSGAFNTNLDPSSLASDPGYQFRMQEGQKALERSAASRGGLSSGGFMKGLDRYSQGFASNEYGQAFQRQQTENINKFSRLYQLAGMGQSAASGMGNMSANYANSMSSLYGAMGNAQAAGAMAPYNAAAGAVRSGGYLTNPGMSMMSGGGGGGGGGASSLGSMFGGGGAAAGGGAAVAGGGGGATLGGGAAVAGSAGAGDLIPIAGMAALA